MGSQISEYQFASDHRSHMILKVLVDILEFCVFFSKFLLYVVRGENILQVDPVLLHHQPVIDNQCGIVECFLQFFGLNSLPFQVSVAQDARKIG